MVEQGKAAFLRQAHENNWKHFTDSLESAARLGWDVCLLTASDARQADMYEKQLELRRQAGTLPRNTRFVVIADPDGRRIGSGGATLRLLTLLEGGPSLVAEGKSPRDQRILIIHSGGDSRRLPHCSVTGKLFARVPRILPDGRDSTLFDECLISLSGLAPTLPPGVLIAAGDALLIFDHLQLSFHRKGVIGVAAVAPVSVATRHGVYVSSEGTHHVQAYLHKPSVSLMRKWRAVADDNTALVDTGLVWLDAATVPQYVALAREEAVARLWCESGDTVPETESGLNLYGDLLLPLAMSTTWDTYRNDTSDGPANQALQRARRVIWEQLRGVPFTVERLHPAEFLHYGTSYEYWHVSAANGQLAMICGWNSGLIHATLPTLTPPGATVLVNSVIEKSSTTLHGQNADAPFVVPSDAPVLVTDSHLKGSFECRGAAIIANVHTTQTVRLAADTVLHQLPLQEGFVTRIYGLRDDPKKAWDDPAGTIFGRPWKDWLQDAGIGADIIWPQHVVDERTLWNAQLYPVTVNREESLALSLPLQDPTNAAKEWRERWIASERVSLAESFARADGAAILTELVTLADVVAAHRFHAAIEAEQPITEVTWFLGNEPKARQRRTKLLQKMFSNDDPLLQMRGYMSLSMVMNDSSFDEKAFSILRSLIAPQPRQTRSDRSHCLSSFMDMLARQEECRSVRVASAARIDFGGGWTDTPPFSIERGGTVLNAAVVLRGEHPIVAEACVLPEPALVLESADIESTLEPVYVHELMSHSNPADHFALHKAALVLRNFIPRRCPGETFVIDLLRKTGRGLRIRTETCVPRGSGLGTSSIMGATVLKCLDRLLGVEVSTAQLFEDVLQLEQMLTTGGGWQDQVGGLTPGIKLVSTQPGLPQKINVEPLQLPEQVESELRERLLLVYTGQQRLAKDLLQAMMRRWIRREREMSDTLLQIGALARAMRDTLLAGDIEGLGALLTEHWELNKYMDSGSSNVFIDRLFEVMSPYISGGKLAGAGGGGFAFVLARSADDRPRLSQALAAHYPGTPVAIWEAAISADAMKVEDKEVKL